MIKGLAHICFLVQDLEASLTFYRDTLGLAAAFDFVNDKGVRFGVYLCAGGSTFIELFKGEPGEVSGKPSYQHFCLQVDDVAQTVTELRAKGLTVSDAKMGSDNSWQAWLSDPDGNRIELHGYTPESKQTTWER